MRPARSGQHGDPLPWPLVICVSVAYQEVENKCQGGGKVRTQQQNQSCSPAAAFATPWFLILSSSNVTDWRLVEWWYPTMLPTTGPDSFKNPCQEEKNPLFGTPVPFLQLVKSVCWEWKNTRCFQKPRPPTDGRIMNCTPLFRNSPSCPLEGNRGSGD